MFSVIYIFSLHSDMIGIFHREKSLTELSHHTLFQSFCLDKHYNEAGEAAKENAA